MRKRFLLCSLVIILSLTIFVSAVAIPTAQDVAKATGNKISDVAHNPNVYVEALGQNLLKLQSFLMGSLTFLSFGAFQKGGTLAFAQFLFMILIFMIIYTTFGFFLKKFNFIFAFCITALAFIGIDAQILESILMNYSAMGITITVILPVLILLAFTFRIYQRAYEGKSETSPFYAEMFNLAFLIFFGIFFIRYSSSEQGAIAMMRYVSGWILIVTGIGQTVLYKILARMIHKTLVDDKKFIREIKKTALDAADEIKLKEAGLNLDV